MNGPGLLVAGALLGAALLATSPADAPLREAVEAPGAASHRPEHPGGEVERALLRRYVALHRGCLACLAAEDAEFRPHGEQP
jgi:hypothetical protein